MTPPKSQAVTDAVRAARPLGYRDAYGAFVPVEQVRLVEHYEHGTTIHTHDGQRARFTAEHMRTQDTERLDAHWLQVDADQQSAFAKWHAAQDWSC